jgi:hypothetical protein
MRYSTIAVLLLILVFSFPAVRNHAAQRRIQIVGPAADLNFRLLERPQRPEALRWSPPAFPNLC